MPTTKRRVFVMGKQFVKLNGAIRYSRKACARWLAERQASTGGNAA